MSEIINFKFHWAVDDAIKKEKEKKETDNFFFFDNIRREMITFVPTWSYYNPQTNLSSFTNLPRGPLSIVHVFLQLPRK